MAQRARYNQYNRLNDFLFKFIFGSESRKNITIDFLNAVLDREGESSLKDIEFLDRERDPQTRAEKLSILDIYGITNDGSRINIEVQVADLGDMEKRTLYYWAKNCAGALKSGESYKKLPMVVNINILNFSILPQDKPHAVYGVYNPDNMHRLTDSLELHFIELPKFEIKSLAEMRHLDKWMAYFSGRATHEEMEAIAVENPAINEALEAEEMFMQDEAMRHAYINQEKAVRDYYSGLDYAARKGRTEGAIQATVELCQEFGKTFVETVEILQRKFKMSDEAAHTILRRYGHD